MKKFVLFIFILMLSIKINAQEASQKDLRVDRVVEFRIMEQKMVNILSEIRDSFPVEGKPLFLFKTPIGFMLFTRQNGKVIQYLFRKNFSVLKILRPIEKEFSLFKKLNRNIIEDEFYWITE